MPREKGNVYLSRQEIDDAIDAIEVQLTEKRKSLKVVLEAGLNPGGRQFRPEDFGIPRLEALINKLNGIEE